MTNLWLVLNFVFGSFARFSSFPFVFLCFCTSVCLFICLFVCFFYQIPFAPSSPPLPTLLPPLPPLLPPLPTLLPLSHLFALFFCFLISSVSLIVREVIFFLLSFDTERSNKNSETNLTQALLDLKNSWVAVLFPFYLFSSKTL